MFHIQCCILAGAIYETYFAVRTNLTGLR